MSTETEEKTLSESELAVLRAEVREKIITARIGLLLRHPWFGNMATRLVIKEADDWCPTAATNGRDLFYSTEFFSELDIKEIEFVIAHEIIHCVFDHLTRREDRIPELHNIACDYLVNNLLIRDRIGKEPKGINIFKSTEYEGWSSEEVYDDLFEKAEKIDISDLGQLLDEHVDWEKGDGEDAENGRPVLTQDEMRSIRDDIKENMISAAQATGAGNVPSEIQRIIKQLTEPKMNWREILQQQIQSTVRSDYTFIRPSRKGWHTNAILPGMDRDSTIEIAVSLDMSGSISDKQARDFLSEVKGIMDQYADYVIDLWTFDTRVYNHKRFTADNGEDILTYEIKGGGGTEFMCNWEFMKEQDIVPNKLILFSDMYAYSEFGDESYCDTVFINHGRPGFEAPFGVTVPYS